MDGAAIEVRGVTKRFRPDVAAVDGLSFSVDPGQVCGLLGPNGAGKTTTLRILLGLVHPNAGSASILGERMHPGHPVLARVGAIVETPSFILHLSGLTNLRLHWRAGGGAWPPAGLDHDRGGAAAICYDSKVEAGKLIREARREAGLSQREMAARAGTSGPTVAAYESGRVEPRWSTVERLLVAAGRRLHVQTEPLAEAMTREERRSLHLHHAIAAEVRARPLESLHKARHNLRTMRRADTGGRASRWLDAWDRLLQDGDAKAVVRVLTDAHDPNARELRQNTPFAGVLSPRKRWDQYRRFQTLDACDATSSSM